MSAAAIQIRDYNTTASQVFLAALGADGTPALLAADRPAALAQKFRYTGGTLTSIEYYAGYDPATQTGDLIAIDDFS
jgi:hypothetical protein